MNTIDHDTINDNHQDAKIYEEQNVHQIYQSIAFHFSSTRYKPWPIIDSFIRALPSGSIGLDIGCGNGKYLAIRQDIYIIGSDRSSELLKFAAQHQPHDVYLADALSTGVRESSCDFAISIAVLHHLSTRDRRVEGVRECLRVLGDQGEALIFVWALEQGNSRRGWNKDSEQDQMVPWVNKSDGKTYERFYHLYREGELEEDVFKAGGEVVRHGYDRDNWWCVVRRKRGG